MSVVLSSYRDAAAFRDGRFNPVVVAENERARAMLVCFEPGQFIPVHAPGVDLALVILEGEGQLVAGGAEQPVTAGAVAFIPAGERRGIRAETRLVAFQVVTPPPTDADHAAVVHGLETGQWR